jgi:hypothetical protein
MLELAEKLMRGVSRSLIDIILIVVFNCSVQSFVWVEYDVLYPAFRLHGTVTITTIYVHLNVFVGVLFDLSTSGIAPRVVVAD